MIGMKGRGRRLLRSRRKLPQPELHVRADGSVAYHYVA